VSVATIGHEWPQLFEAVEPRSGLDNLIVGLWEELTSGRAVRCPICDGDMRPGSNANARLDGGQCDQCGTKLA
jgi:hypothetical protein